MPQLVYRGNVSAKWFPFLSSDWGRSIVVRGQDQDFNRQTYSPENPEKDIGIPQAYYMHNVMPTVTGFQSIGYLSPLQSCPDTSQVFNSVFIIRDANDNKTYMGVTNSGQLWFNSGSGWVLKGTYSNPGVITVAYVSGVSYIYLQNYGCFTYNLVTKVLATQTLTALGAGIIGICASFGYLIAWSVSAVAWSSLVTPTDFTPSLTTGAGGGSVQGVKGGITICVQHTQGFIVYTTENAVAAIYSGNAQYPFNFRPIVSSGGVASLNLVGYDANTGNQYVYSTSGLQIVATTATQTPFPEVTDFISGHVFEDFDDVAKTFSTVQLSYAMQKQINVIADRYMIVSYGIYGLTHALVYDISQKRWGKIRCDHVGTIEFVLTVPGITEIPKQCIGLMQANGQIQVVDFTPNNSSNNGTILLGKYQYVRSRFLCLEEIVVENINSATLTVFTALDGKTGTPSIPTLQDRDNGQSRYTCRKTGLNHSLLLQGNFKLESLVLTYHIQGKR